MLVEFASVVDAVRCAVAVQQAMPERNTGVGTDNRIELRVGINLGDVIVEGDDLYGDGVNIAARVEALADAGALDTPAARPVRRLGFMAGQIAVPDDFDRMGNTEIEELFHGGR
jgi:class 3 adenylate cyclase